VGPSTPKSGPITSLRRAKGPLENVRKAEAIWQGKTRMSLDGLLLWLLLRRSVKRKSFTINDMHGEGIEPPTYWV
jgi:hypothetical protein